MQHWEHLLSNWVSFLIVPIFAFFNAGVDLRNVSVNDLTHPVVLGVALGLIIGKQIGIFWCSICDGEMWPCTNADRS